MVDRESHQRGQATGKQLEDNNTLGWTVVTTKEYDGECAGHEG